MMRGLRHGLSAHMAMHPDHVCITIDAKNAFNAFDRAKAMKVLYDTIGKGTIGARVAPPRRPS